MERRHVDAAGEARRSTAGGPRGSRSVATAAIALQRTAGNRAATRLLTRHRTPLLQRWEGPEHREIGDATGATIDLGSGVSLSWGQVVALAGDEYGTVSDLYNDAASVNGRRRLRAHLEHDGVLDAQTARRLPASNADDVDEVRSQFASLAFDNVEHFVEGGGIQAWREHHARALELATRAGYMNAERLFQVAQLTEAFGQHFLTDAFSAGHMRTPRRAINAWYETFAGPRLRVGLTGDVAAAARRHTAALFGGWWSQAAQDSAAASVSLAGEALRIFTSILGRAIAGAVSGTLHDRENDRGLQVSSASHPTEWHERGDTHLHDQDPVGELEAADAVIIARGHLLAAREAGRRARAAGQGAQPALPGIEHYRHAYPDVEDHVPRPTAANAPVPEWRWGHLDPTLIPAINEWVPRRVRSYRDDLARRTWWESIPIRSPPGTVLNLREAVLEVVDQLLRDPVRYLERHLGPANPARASAATPPRGRVTPDPNREAPPAGRRQLQY